MHYLRADYSVLCYEEGSDGRHTPKYRQIFALAVAAVASVAVLMGVYGYTQNDEGHRVVAGLAGSVQSPRAVGADL